MDYEISLSDDKSFVIVHVKKPLSPDIALIFTKESAEFASKHNIKNYLIDMRDIEKHTWSVWETYQFAQELKKYGRQHLDKVAVLVRPNDKTFSFIETTTVNQGFNTKIFTNLDDTIAWFGERVSSN